MYRDVLVIAYYFPPMGLSGVQRTVKFVKYLPQHGWRPVVLTVSPGGYYAYDESLLKEVEDAGAGIIRTGSVDPTRLYKKGETVKMPREVLRKTMNRLSQAVFIPDNKIGWKKQALKLLGDLRSNYNFELVFSTAPPFTDHLIGRDISRGLHIPLVLDYRDAWLDYQFAFYPTPLHKYLHYRLEKSCVRAANSIVVVNRPIKIKILEQFSFLHYNDVHIIPQGFDPADFQTNTAATEPNPGGEVPAAGGNGARPLRITHTGTFIEDITPVPLLRAVAKIMQENPHMKGRIRLSFAGIFRKEHMKHIAKLGLQEEVEVLGYIDHQACARLMTESDVLFITLGKKRSHEHHTTGKLYDYFGARKSILAAVPPGVVAQTISEIGAGIVTDPENVDEIAGAIRTFYDKRDRNELQPIPESAVEKYDRTRLTEQLAQIFNKVTEYNLP
jgi:glycosyltransferase involved in cell wall biosynthesis